MDTGTDKIVETVYIPGANVFETLSPFSLRVRRCSRSFVWRGLQRTKPSPITVVYMASMSVAKYHDHDT